MNTVVLFDILQHHLDKSSGTWSVIDPRSKKAGRAIFFQAGQIAHAMSAYEGETLADVLVAQGRIDPGRLRLVLDGKLRLSEEVAPDDLGHAVEGVASKVVQGVLMDEMEEGTEPQFVAGEAPSTGGPAINSRNAILLGILGASSGNYTMTLLGSPNQDAILHPSVFAGIKVPEDLQWVMEFLTPDDAPVESKRTTLGAIIRKSGRERGRVGGLLYFLREVGALSFVPVASARQTQATHEFYMDTPEALEAAPIQAGPVTPVIPVPLPEPEDDVGNAIWGAPSFTPHPASEPTVLYPEIIEDDRYAKKDSWRGRGSNLPAPSMGEVAETWGIPVDGTQTMSLQRPMPLMERRMVDPKLFLEAYDPNFKGFTVPLVVEHKIHGKSMAIIMTGIGAAVALGIAAMALVWVRTERPKLLKPGTIKVDRKGGPVGFDQVSRAQTLRDQELGTALVQGDAYVAKLQSDGKNPYVIRLGLAFQGPDVLKTLNTLGPGWAKEDVFILPIRLEGDKEAYQVFVGVYSDEEVEAAVARISKLSEAKGGSSVTAYHLREIPRGA